MKLIIAIVSESDMPQVVSDLTKKGATATHLASMGGFLSQSKSTLLVGAREEDVAGIVDCIVCRCRRPDSNCEVTMQEAADLPREELNRALISPPRGGATVFVLNLSEVLKI